MIGFVAATFVLIMAFAAFDGLSRGGQVLIVGGLALFALGSAALGLGELTGHVPPQPRRKDQSGPLLRMLVGGVWAVILLAILARLLAGHSLLR
jgi:hypothetical protein